MSIRGMIPLRLGLLFADFALALCSGHLQFSTVAQAKDAVILDPTTHPIRIGTTSKFAQFQAELKRRLQQCNTEATSVRRDAHGTLGPGTAQAIREALTCKSFRGVPRNSPAQRGALTVSIWEAVMAPEPLPALDDVVEALTLSFEATDFSDRPEWNFCQDTLTSSDTPAEEAARGGKCYNVTDPCSMLTWGPRGATAGRGGEIRWILRKVWRTEPSLIIKAFGSEFENVQRFLRLKGPPADRCDGTTPLEHFMCAVWIDPRRRRAWEEGLVELGRSSLVRSAYRQIYAGHNFDGYKLRDYYRLWHSVGIAPSEIDYAFFFDRATHIGGPPPLEQSEIANLRTCIERQTAAKTAHAAARRCLSLQRPHPEQPADRLGRDVAYYLDSFPRRALTKKELETWDTHIPLVAGTNFGLSDERHHPFKPILPSSSDVRDALPLEDTSLLTKQERACPRSIRSPLRTLPPQSLGSEP